MFRFALVALLATSACRESLDDGDDNPGGGDAGGGRQCMPVPTNAQCKMASDMPAETAKLSWIEQNIFTANCGTGSCHGLPPGGGTPAGRVVLTANSHAVLVNADTTLATGVKLIVPNNVTQSYLMVLMKHLTPEAAGAPPPARNAYMPLGSPPVCCEKLDALERWIMAGAPNN